MITRKQAQAALHAFTWTDGEAFLDAYEKLYGDRPRWDGYMSEQFTLMQTKPLDFIVKWDVLAGQILLAYQASKGY